MKYPLDIHVLINGNYVKLDTFKDETLIIKEQVKDFKDVKKLFTSKSRSFTIPASRNNSKALKHFYRGDIYDVDVRALVDAKLTLNQVDYSYGNVSLESTKFKDNEPHSYTLRFYGQLTELNKKIGEDELTDLDTSTYDIVDPNFRALFGNPSKVQSTVAFPLMSRNRRFIAGGAYDYAQTNNLENVAKVDKAGAVSTRVEGHYGVVESDLVGAIHTGAILDSIENKYGVNFTGALADASYIRELRLMLHRKTGGDIGGNPFISKNASSFTPTRLSGDRYTVTDDKIVTEQVYSYTSLYLKYKGNIEYTINTSAPNFRVNLKRDGTIVETVDSNGTYLYPFGTSDNNSEFTFECEVQGIATVNVTCTIETWRQSKTTTSDFVNHTFSGSANFTGSSGNTYVVKDNLPTMKVIDFLSDIFKRFNIVATIDKDLNINTYHFDYFYSQGNEYDISKYVDSSGHSISKPNFYSGIRYTTEPIQTVGEYGFQEVNGRKYGELKYSLLSDGSRLDGEMYEVDIKSNMLPLQKPYYIGTTALADQQWLELTNSKGEEVELSPTFFYTSLYNFQNIAWDNGSYVETVSDYVYMPSEVYYENEDRTTTGLNQGHFTIGSYFSYEISVQEVPEFNFRDASLFQAFHRHSVSVAFDESSRRAEYNAYLPMKILNSLSLADTIIVANKPHLIESYSVNFLTGQTKLSLMQIDTAVRDYFKPKVTTTHDNIYSTRINYLSADTGLCVFDDPDPSDTRNVVGGRNGVYRVTLFD